MQNYEKPILEVITFQKDIITSSDGLTNDGPGYGFGEEDL